MGSISPFDFAGGETLLIDKPLDWTSFQVVALVRNNIKRVTGSKIKVGHAGTLDPKATGLLILCTGKSTRSIQDIQDAEKEYTGTILIGSTRPSFDLETDIDATFATDAITDDEIRMAAKQFIGTTQQTAPDYSAKKVDGVRAYDLARKGKEVTLRPHAVTIKAFELTAINRQADGIHVHFRVECTKGTYIRSLAYDLGQKLNNGGHLIALRRTRIGAHSLADSMGVDQFRQLMVGLISIRDSETKQK